MEDWTVKTIDGHEYVAGSLGWRQWGKTQSGKNWVCWADWEISPGYNLAEHEYSVEIN